MLGDILFKYREKLDRLNSRIDRYNLIVEDYNKKICTAKEKQVDYTSLSNSKSLYEKKIKYMNIVKKEYLDFIETSQFLLDSINSKPGLLEQSKFESLERRCEELQKENDELRFLYSEFEKMSKKFDKEFEISSKMRKEILKLKKEIRELKNK